MAKNTKPPVSSSSAWNVGRQRQRRRGGEIEGYKDAKGNDDDAENVEPEETKPTFTRSSPRSLRGVSSPAGRKRARDSAEVGASPRKGRGTKRVNRRKPAELSGSVGSPSVTSSGVARSAPPLFAKRRGADGWKPQLRACEGAGWQRRGGGRAEATRK
eukprot:GHVT01013752.1.p1 GENE.GHVT01013752.1~~GHVT01013752.1.p1  ORF type:complete len:158 (+),score=34.27 GHVT01013752.1:947-1420(+)